MLTVLASGLGVLGKPLSLGTTAHQGHGIRIAVQLLKSEYARSRGNPFPGPLFPRLLVFLAGLQIFSRVLPFATSNQPQKAPSYPRFPPTGVGDGAFFYRAVTLQSVFDARQTTSQ